MQMKKENQLSVYATVFCCIVETINRPVRAWEHLIRLSSLLFEFFDAGKMDCSRATDRRQPFRGTAAIRAF